MERINVARDIQPLSVFRKQASALIDRLQKSRRPLVLTRNGRSAVVVLDAGEFERMVERIELLEDVQTAVSAHGEQLSAIADVGGKKTSKDEKITAIATFAMRKSDANSTKVLVDAGEIQGCVDCSRRYAYDLIDDLAEDDRAEWASLQKAESVPTHKGHREKKKALRVDVDVLRESSQDYGVVNKFTTRPPTGGA